MWQERFREYWHVGVGRKVEQEGFVKGTEKRKTSAI